MVVWITGLSGAGKTTLARTVVAGVRRRGVPAVHLDGDAVRNALDDPHVGHDRESRIRNAKRISHLAALLEQQGLVVVVSTMSLFHEIHELNRGLFGAYYEVFLRVDVETLKRRDSRGLYSRAAQGHETNVAGVDLAAEFPLEPHLVLCNDKHRESLSTLASRVVRAVIRPQDRVSPFSTTGARTKSNTGLPAKGRPKKRG